MYLPISVTQSSDEFDSPVPSDAEVPTVGISPDEEAGQEEIAKKKTHFPELSIKDRDRQGK